MGQTVNEQLIRAATKPAPLLLSVVPAAPPPVVEIVDRALKFEKADRWPTAAAMQEAVRHARRLLPIEGGAPAVAMPVGGPEGSPSGAKADDNAVTLVKDDPKGASPLAMVPDAKLHTLATAGAMTRSDNGTVRIAGYGRLVVGVGVGVAAIAAAAFMLLRDGAPTTTTTAAGSALSAMPTASSAPQASVDAATAQMAGSRTAGSSPREALSGVRPEQLAVEALPAAKAAPRPAPATKAPTKKADDWLHKRN
jgi:hypothetical protein